MKAKETKQKPEQSFDVEELGKRLRIEPEAAGLSLAALGENIKATTILRETFEYGDNGEPVERLKESIQSPPTNVVLDYESRKRSGSRPETEFLNRTHRAIDGFPVLSPHGPGVKNSVSLPNLQQQMSRWIVNPFIRFLTPTALNGWNSVPQIAFMLSSQTPLMVSESTLHKKRQNCEVDGVASGASLQRLRDAP